MIVDYAEFLAQKVAVAREYGPTVKAQDCHPMLHEWQAEIVAWAARVGRAAVWADTGLGKTLIQVEWARLVTTADQMALIVAPLAVCQQTIREAAKLDVDVTYVRHRDEITGPGLYITNYEMADRLDADALSAVVLDEASILKQSDGKTRTRLIAMFECVPYRLACTATPAPNDPEELTNQAAFLGHSTRANMLAAYFVHDQDGWRLKGHARRPMLRWMASWAVALRRPSDMGYPDDGYVLPGLEIVPHVLDVEVEPTEGELFTASIGGVGGRAKVRRATVAARCAKAVSLVNESHFGAKLTTCHGSPNTKTTGEPEWLPTPNIEPESKSSGSAELELPKRTGSTSANTTRPTKTPANGSGPQSSKPSTTGDVASATPTTPSIESAPRHQSPRLTSDLASTPDSKGSSGSLSTSMKLCSNIKGAPARSAEAGSGADLGTGSVSTIATQQERSEDCCAVNATSGSASFETARNCCETQRTTSNLEPWIIWCGRNDEQAFIKSALGDRAFSLEGSMSPEEKVDILYRWLDGERPVMISKASILGSGINMQHCARMAFVGLSDSYEQYYQAIRRCYRYGQTRVVHAHVVLSGLESQIAANVARKEREATRMTAALVREMQIVRMSA